MTSSGTTAVLGRQQEMISKERTIGIKGTMADLIIVMVITRKVKLLGPEVVMELIAMGTVMVDKIYFILFFAPKILVENCVVWDRR